MAFNPMSEKLFDDGPGHIPEDPPTEVFSPEDLSSLPSVDFNVGIKLLEDSRSVKPIVLVEGLDRTRSSVIDRDIRYLEGSQTFGDVVQRAAEVSERWEYMQIFRSMSHHFEPVRDGEIPEVLTKWRYEHASPTSSEETSKRAKVSDLDVPSLSQIETNDYLETFSPSTERRVLTRFQIEENPSRQEIGIFTTDSLAPELRASLRNIQGRALDLSLHYLPSRAIRSSGAFNLTSHSPFWGRRAEFYMGRRAVGAWGTPQYIPIADQQILTEARLTIDSGDSMINPWFTSLTTGFTRRELTLPREASDASEWMSSTKSDSTTASLYEPKSPPPELSEPESQKDFPELKTASPQTETDLLAPSGDTKKTVCIPYDKMFVRFIARHRQVEFHRHPSYREIYTLPVSGHVAQSSLELALPFLRGWASHIKGDLILSNYRQLFPAVTLETNLRLQYSWALEAIATSLNSMFSPRTFPTVPSFHEKVHCEPIESNLSPFRTHEPFPPSESRRTSAETSRQCSPEETEPLLSFPDRTFLTWRHVRGYRSIGPSSLSNINDEYSDAAQESRMTNLNTPTSFRALGGNLAWSAGASLNMPTPLFPYNGIAGLHFFGNLGQNISLDFPHKLWDQIGELLLRPQGSVGVGLVVTRFPLFSSHLSGRLEFNLSLPFSVSGNRHGPLLHIGAKDGRLFQRFQWGLHWTNVNE